MGRIVVRKCPWTGRIFEDDSEYAEHLLNRRSKIKAERDLAKLKRNFKRKINPIFRLNSIEEVEAWLNENIYWICAHGANVSPYRRKTDKLREPTSTIQIRLLKMKFNKACSTSHSAPIGQKTTGWFKHSPHIPEMGWEGEIVIDFEGNGYEYFDSDYLTAVGINTGSGGGGPYRLRYGVTLFAKDFKGLAKMQVLERLITE